MRKKKGKEEKRLVRVTVSVEPEDYALFERLGENSGLSAAWLIRRAMREFLERTETGLTVNFARAQGQDDATRLADS